MATPFRDRMTPQRDYPDLESNQDPDLRRVLCVPLHHRDIKGRRLDSHQHEPVYKTGAFLFRATSAPMTNDEIQKSKEARMPMLESGGRQKSSFRLRISSFFRHSSFGIRHSRSTSARIRTPSGGFGDRLLSQEHTRVSLRSWTGGRVTTTPSATRSSTPR